MELTAHQIVMTIKTEIRRRHIARWAMITRKMKHEEPPNNLEEILDNSYEFSWTYRDKVLHLISLGIVPILIGLLLSRVGNESLQSAMTLENIVLYKPDDVVAITPEQVRKLESILKKDTLDLDSYVKNAIKEIIDPEIIQKI
jgi:hypothetical protein